MKITLPFIILILCVAGCSKFGSGTPSTSNTNIANANASPPQIKKVIDLPATFGKTKDEIKKLISAAPKNEDPWLEYELPEAGLTFMFGKDKKADRSHFSFTPIRVGDSSISGFETAEQLATMAGIDIKGKSPAHTGALADTYEQEINGKKVDMAFYKTNGKFDKIIIRPK